MTNKEKELDELIKRAQELVDVLTEQLYPSYKSTLIDESSLNMEESPIYDLDDLRLTFHMHIPRVVVKTTFIHPLVKEQLTEKLVAAFEQHITNLFLKLK